MQISVKSKQVLSVSVYPSKDRAMKDDTYSRYRVDTASGETEINFPHAWSGPYYVKVLYLGSEEDSRDEEEDAAYKIGYKGANLPPSEPVFLKKMSLKSLLLRKSTGVKFFNRFVQSKINDSMKQQKVKSFRVCSKRQSRFSNQSSSNIKKSSKRYTTICSH